MRNQLKKWFAVLMAMVLGMPGYGLSIKNITTKAEDESIVIHIENEERHVQTGETVFLLDGVSVEGSGEESYRAVVGDVQEQDSGLSLYEEGMEELVIPEDAAGKTYRVLYKAQSSIDNEVWNDVEGSEKEVLFIVEGSSESEEVTITEEKQEETEKEEDEETVEPKTVTIQGEEERTILAENEYDFIRGSDLVVKGPKEEENSYRLKVKEVKSPENGSYQYHEGDESFTPKESDEGLVYEVTYVAETSKDETTWKEVEGVQFIQKLMVAVFRAEEVRGPLATEAILCTGQQFNNFVKNWNSGSSTKVKNLVKADVPSDLMTASLRYKYETISDPSSPVKIYMWHDMNAYGQYTDTVYFGTEVPGATVYTNSDASYMFDGDMTNYKPLFEKIYDSANPSTPYFFNTSKTTNMSRMFENVRLSSVGIPFDCTNGNGVSPFGLMDTSNVTDLSWIFSYAEKLDLTGIETWDVHKVTDISNLFRIFMGKIPWDIGNWAFDNLQNVSNCFMLSQSGKYEINVMNWDLSHCDAKYMFSVYNNVERLGIGPKLIDKNGKVYLPDTHLMERVYSGSDTVNTKFNGTWKNENTGVQYFQRKNINNQENRSSYDFYQTGNGESVTEFEEAYLASPVGMSGVYVPGKGYCITYQSASPSYPKDVNGKIIHTFCYKHTDTTATLAVNPFTWAYHYFQKWEDQSTSPRELKNPGDTVLLNRNYFFYGTWGANERTITYDLDGGVNYVHNPTKFIAGIGTSFIDPTKSGMIFVGWTWTSASKSMPDPWYIHETNSDNGGARSFPDEDVVLKAHWASPRVINIHGNGGTAQYNGSGPAYPDISMTIPEINDVQLLYSLSYSNETFIGWALRGKEFLSQTYNSYIWHYENHVSTGLKDGSGNVIFNITRPDSTPYKTAMPIGTNDFYMQWKRVPKQIKIRFNPTIPFSYMTYNRYLNPDGSQGTTVSKRTLDEYTGGQWDETSPNVTISLKGHETGSPNEYVFYDFEDINTSPIIQGYLYQSFTISVASGSSHTYPTGNLTSYTFTGGFDKDVTITFNWARAWRVQYVNLDDTPITTMQTMTEADLPYTFRNTYPPHAPWHGFPVLPVGWTLGKYNQGSPDATGIYTSTGNLPTLFKGTFDAATFNTVQSTLKLYPMYSVDVNNDGIPDLFQNKNTLTVSKEVLKGQYTDLTSLMNKVFPYEITFKDVHGDPIKNWPVQDTNGQTYTTDSNGKVTINLRHQESVSFKGMLVGMIIQAVETDTKGMSAEYAISYNGTSFTSGSDTGSITYQDNTPLTVTFKNTAGGNIVPAGIKDTNTRVYVLLGAVLIALAFSIRMLKVRRRA